MKIWYMRDNHTFKELPFDMKESIDILKDEFLNGNSYGMLCSKGSSFNKVVHAKSTKEWESFIESAKVWLQEAIEVKNSEKTETEAREKIINNMCFTYRHDYGLMEETQRQALYDSMAQIFDNDIEPYMEFKK